MKTDSHLQLTSVSNSPRSIYYNSNMARRLSCYISISGLVFVVHKSRLGIGRQWSRAKFAILSIKPRSYVRVLI